jgi:hypothetical protein
MEESEQLSDCRIVIIQSKFAFSNSGFLQKSFFSFLNLQVQLRRRRKHVARAIHKVEVQSSVRLESISALQILTLCFGVMESEPPRFDGSSLDFAWLRAVLCASDSDSVSCRPLDDVGGMISQLYKISWASLRDGATRKYVFKQISTEAKLATSAVLGYAREVQFYRHDLSNEIAYQLMGVNEASRLIPTCVYAHANKETGEKYLMMEDLGEGTSELRCFWLFSLFSMYSCSFLM